ncbi:MAG: ABC transporter ATP-binding protein [Candidatus Korobacteraceae bacterium]
MSSLEHAIRVDDLRHTYRKGRTLQPALSGLTFTVSPGQIYGLLGPNGAGKSTVVRILTSIVRPTSGRAWVNGHDVVRDALGVRRSITAVLQENAVETLLSVWDNLLVCGYLHGCSRAEARRRAEAVVESMELQDFLKERAQTLSGGYKRRLQMAKALMVDTPVLFLDEATTGMDPLVKRRTIQLIREQAASGRTVLLTTQLLDEAEALCDRMLLIDRGRAIAQGTLAELRALSRRVFHIQLGFARSDAELSESLQKLGPRSMEEKDGEYALVVEGSEDEWIRNMAMISQRWPISNLEFRGASLEQIFFDLYGHNGNETASGEIHKKSKDQESKQA